MKQTTFKDYQARMLRVLVYIQQNLDSDLSIEQLARVAYFSPFHFHRIFRGMVGESLLAHIRRIRLERAAQRLKAGTESILDIALEAGYESNEAFTRAFRNLLGVTPSRFRAGSRREPIPPAPAGIHYGAESHPDGFRPLETGGGTMEVKIVRRERERIAFVRHVGPYDRCAQAWARLLSRLGPDGWVGADATMLGVCHDDPDVTPPEKIRYDACVTVADRFEPEGDIGLQTLPAGDYAMTTHQGPYAELGRTYSLLCGEWIPRSGRLLRGAPCLEIYLNDPEGTEPEELLTDIYVPLEPVDEEEI